MENVQIHSRSYIVRWVHVAEGHSITWSVQPHKKSINFGIFKHPGAKSDLSANDGLDSGEAISPTGDDKSKRRGSVSVGGKHGSNTIIEKLQHIGLKCVDWVGNCEADKVSMGTYDVPAGQEGTYGLVFDNTFSKTVSKTATFVLMTHPTNAPPKSKALLTPASQNPPPTANGASGKSPGLRPTTASTETLDRDTALQPPVEASQPARQRRNTIGNSLEILDIHTGIMWKKRRKKGQGWAKRFFSLDFTSSTLSYYRDRHSSALRGAVPLSLAAVGADENTREFSIDSGAEVWHLKASNTKEFEEWKWALEKASNASIHTPGPGTPAGLQTSYPFAPANSEQLGNVEWEKAESLLSRISGSRDALRRLAQDTEPKATSNGLSNAESASPSGLSLESASNPFFADADEAVPERRSFWQRKASNASTSPANFKRKASAQQLSVPGTPPVPQSSPSPGSLNVSKVRPSTANSVASQAPPLGDVHDRCVALLKDLDAVVTDFSALLTETKARRLPNKPSMISRMSIDSTASSEEFFDAEDRRPAGPVETPSQLLTIRRSSDQRSGEAEPQDTSSVADDSESSSDAGDSNTSSSLAGAAVDPATASSLFPVKPRTLAATMAHPTKWRISIPPPKQPPPSLVSFLRKNAGKDLSTVSMPVSANEPLSALQRLAEPFEAAELLHTAASLDKPDQAADRLLYVAAFAVTNFASNRVKERAQRKPFNPMLGETYELVRSDLGFRFVSEKVVHRPVRMAWQADALSGKWSLSQSAQPTQKFWGKSAELNTEGRMRLALHDASESGEHYSWALATAYLRNVIAGEKYIEPTASMTILNETTGMKAVATFKAAGMFSGRSEDVSVALYEAGSTTPMSLGLNGKWTSSLTRTDSEAIVWDAAPLVENANKNWGFTTFAAALNQISSSDQKLLPPTDSRLRPDQRALEEGQLDEAEALKARLEERQRARRKVFESHGSEWKPRFFEKLDTAEQGASDEEVWILRVGREGYWECRERNSWEGVSRVFEV